MKNVLLFTDINGWYGLARYAGTYRVATELRRAGFDCQVVDYFTNFSIEQVLDVVRAFVDSETLFVGFSTTLLTLENSSAPVLDIEDLNTQCGHYYGCKLLPQGVEFTERLFSAIRTLNPKVKIVVGGAKVMYSQDYPGVDYWLSGQADVSVVALAQYLSGEKNKIIREENFNGSFTVYSNRDYSFQGFQSAPIEYLQSDILDPGEALPLEISRGCAFNCSFCTFEKRENSMDYVKSADCLSRELLTNYERFGITRYMLCDDTYNDSIQKVEFLYKLFKELPFKPEFTTYARLDMLHAFPRMTEMMIESGCRSVFFGVETLSKSAGAKVGKGLGKEKIFKIVEELKRTWKDEIFTAGSFILGLPGENEQSMRETVNWVHNDLPFDSWFWNVLMLRNRDHLSAHGVSSSPMSKNPSKYGIQEVQGNFQEWNSEEFSLGQAIELQREARSHSAFSEQNRLWTGHGWLNMMWNLGYSNMECKEMALNNIRDRDCLVRKKLKVEQYYSRLMSFAGARSL